MPTRSIELLRAAHAHPGLTRAEAARLLGVGTGAATEIVARLAQAEPAGRGPGRAERRPRPPDHRAGPAPQGPLVLAAAITHETWRVDVVELGGTVLATAEGGTAPSGRPWPTVLAATIADVPGPVRGPAAGARPGGARHRDARPTASTRPPCCGATSTCTRSGPTRPSSSRGTTRAWPPRPSPAGAPPSAPRSPCTCASRRVWAEPSSTTARCSPAPPARPASSGTCRSATPRSPARAARRAAGAPRWTAPPWPGCSADRPRRTTWRTPGA